MSDEYKLQVSWVRVVNSATPCPLHVMRSVALWKWRMVASLSAGVVSLQCYLAEKVRHFPGNISAAGAKNMTRILDLGRDNLPTLF